MKIVIDIPKDDYKTIIARLKNYNRAIDDEVRVMANVIAKGTPLPKGHGRLIDADALPLNAIDDANSGRNFIRIAPTIIKADTESEYEE